jgi:GT2 family glycosyltransferase
VFCIIPVFNRIQATLKCIGCLQEQTYRPLTIVVADGGSTDGTQERIRQDYPDVVLLEGRKLWWAGATRVGIDWALKHSKNDSDFVMLVNNDTTFDQLYVEQLVDYCREHQAAMSGLVVDALTEHVSPVAGAELDWSTFRFRRTALVPRAGGVKLDCSVLSGRGTIIPIAAVRKAGNIDDKNFPHYLSDYEFTYRLRSKGGIRLGIAYDVLIRTPLHHTNRSKGASAPRSFIDKVSDLFSVRSKRYLPAHLRFMDKHAPPSKKRNLKWIFLKRNLKRILRPGT